MTPEIRAARDRIAAFLTAFRSEARWTGEPDAVAGRITAAMPDPAENAPGVDLLAADLEMVLSALDQQPDGIIQFPHDMSGEDVERFRAEWDAAQGPERALTVSLDNRTATFRAKPWPAGPPDAAQLDYRAARRQQHPTDPQTSDE